MKLKLFITMLITFSLNINNISWNFGYTQIGDEPFDGEMLYGHHENYGKIGDYSIHSSKTVIGENNEYIFAMIFPRYNDLKDEGFTRSGLYKNDGKNTPVYYLPEVDADKTLKRLGTIFIELYVEEIDKYLEKDEKERERKRNVYHGDCSNGILSFSASLPVFSFHPYIKAELWTLTEPTASSTRRLSWMKRERKTIMSWIR